MLFLIFKYYLLKVRDTRKLSLEGLMKNVNKFTILRNKYGSTTRKKKQSLKKNGMY